MEGSGDMKTIDTQTRIPLMLVNDEHDLGYRWKETPSGGHQWLIECRCSWYRICKTKTEAIEKAYNHWRGETDA
jgi:hypothetical protein